MLFENNYPLEDILPDLKEEDAQYIVNNCDYTYEANQICEKDDIDNKVNTADAMVFYMMGYEAAQHRINKVLKAKEIFDKINKIK